MIDTHAHVHDAAYNDDRDQVLERARAAGVTSIVTVGCDISDSRRAMSLAETCGLGWTLGIHPHEAKAAPQDLAQAFDELLAAAPKKPLAIGEAGLDFYYDHSPRESQIAVLEQQIVYARASGLPLVFHQRDAFPKFIEILRAHRFDGMRGIVHCFTGTPAEARTLTKEFGLFLGIGGVVTFKAAGGLREAVKSTGLEWIVLETDCPYLAPVPMRGRRNEPAFLRHTVDALCELLVCERLELLSATDHNARQIYGLNG